MPERTINRQPDADAYGDLCHAFPSSRHRALAEANGFDHAPLWFATRGAAVYVWDGEAEAWLYLVPQTALDQPTRQVRPLTGFVERRPGQGTTEAPVAYDPAPIDHTRAGLACFYDGIAA